MRRVEQRVGLLVADVAVDDRKVQRRVDVAQPLGQHVGLLPPDGRVQRHELAVDVRRRHGVGVRDGHRSHARAGDHLRGIGSHAAQSHDQHVRLPQPVELLTTEQQLGAFQPVVVHLPNIRS